ncbi:SHOCT domain-containing protein [Microbacterium sp. SLBN-146]|uniref:SHOCT domain-containing protein n=1 Tax=Microbacterium sp. SLBN-146 TaxID=2768457 RepID=UPI00114DDB75|nr:SHOCT domain-containing protein [Microbacterium sp. SLBN-146]TQJ32218.1 phospholipase D-like protein [Microbacterium sp. SLBN-146]
MWDIFWLMLWFAYLTAYIYVVVLIISDLFRDTALSGWWKAVWIVFLVFVPFLTALVYLVARGSGIADRAGRGRGVVAEADDYRPRASASPSEDIAQAKALLDAGTISQGEFEALKSKALGNQYFGA